MNNVPASLPCWRPLVLWSLLGIAASYPLFYLADIHHWRTSPELAYIFLNFQEWFVNVSTGAWCITSHGIFIAFCLWWRRNRHPFLSVLVPLSSLPCTAFSMHGMWWLWMGEGKCWLAAFAVAAPILLFFLCREWQRTENPALRVWLVIVLLACSPFGIGLIPALFYPTFPF